MKRILFIRIVVLAREAVADAAMLYRCTDRDGNVLLNDSPPPDARCELTTTGAGSGPRAGPGAGSDSSPRAAIDAAAPRAEVTENLEYTSYTADADSRRSLSAILTESSPLRHDGRVVWGYYDSTLSLKLWWFRKPDGRCRLTRITIEINGNITLPRLQGGTHAQRDRFDRFLSGLRIHELGHHDIDKDGAAEIGRRILALPEMESCAALEAAANDLRQQTITEYRKRSVRYDAETGHGRTQGARLD